PTTAVAEQPRHTLAGAGLLSPFTGSRTANARAETRGAIGRRTPLPSAPASRRRRPAPRGATPRRSSPPPTLANRGRAHEGYLLAATAPIGSAVARPRMAVPRRPLRAVSRRHPVPPRVSPRR